MLDDIKISIAKNDTEGKDQKGNIEKKNRRKPLFKKLKLEFKDISIRIS